MALCHLPDPTPEPLSLPQTRLCLVSARPHLGSIRGPPHVPGRGVRARSWGGSADAGEPLHVRPEGGAGRPRYLPPNTTAAHAPASPAPGRSRPSTGSPTAPRTWPLHTLRVLTGPPGRPCPTLPPAGTCLTLTERAPLTPSGLWSCSRAPSTDTLSTQQGGAGGHHAKQTSTSRLSTAQHTGNGHRTGEEAELRKPHKTVAFQTHRKGPAVWLSG